MLPRIWVVLLTVLLLASQVHAEIQLCDTTAEHADDELVMLVAITVVTPSARAVSTPRPEHVPPAPQLARIFRPPRHVA